MNKKILIIIPARYNSTRFEGKPLASIFNKPMIQHVYERASRSKYIQRVIVATDDERILNAVHSFNGDAVMTSTHHQSGTNRVAEVAKDLDCDWVINLQGDEPLINPAAIEAMTLSIINKNEYCFSLMRNVGNISEFLNPNNVKVVVDKNDYALYFSRSPIPYPNNLCPPCNDIRNLKLDNLNPTANIHLGVYAYQKDFLLQITKLIPSNLEKTESLEQLRIISNGYKIKMLRVKYKSIGVDTKEDIALVQKIMKNDPKT